MNWKNKIKHLKMETAAIYLAFRHPDTPLYAKLAAGVTIGYALSPVDLIPDFIPLLGYLDDLLILPLLLLLSVRLIPDGILSECRAAAKALWQNGRPKHWYYGIPVFLIWLLLAVWIVFTII
ncbi:MAG: YkvA family protein [Oscillospiraceae bacterium]|jgi:uncharacterized membrane protein YkvA (DUF1232 family)